MVQGAGSNVGKSLLVAGLCRVFQRRGLAVRPFKPQNMSNNAAAAHDGGEIGRAQALQARAAGVAPSVHMNPVLLKPESDTGAQIIVQGKRWGTMRAREFGRQKNQLLSAVIDSFERLSRDAELVIVEGAGGPAEINLRDGDIANMGFAEAADVPVIIVGDIERGGVIANLVGTHAVLNDADRARIAGFVVNKFRGDISLFDNGITAIAERTGWTALGVVPFFDDAGVLPAEDILDIDRGVAPAAQDQRQAVKIVVPVAGRIANFDDLDPLKLEPRVTLELVHRGRPLPLDADVILLPGSKSTIGDLIALREEGWDIDIAAHIRRGGRVVGLCGGYQMLGRSIADPGGIEGHAGDYDGLGHLDVATELVADKVVRPVTGRHPASGAPIDGYEIHIGRTSGPDSARPWLEIDGRPAGAVSGDGRVMGSYVHGVFAGDAFRAAFLGEIAAGAGGDVSYEAAVETALDKLADHLVHYLDIDALLAMARSR